MAMGSHIRDLSSIRRVLVESVKKALQQINFENAKVDEKYILKFSELNIIVSVETMSRLLGFKSEQRLQACKSLIDYVDILQGITWGGEGSEEIFWLSEKKVKELGLESELVFRGIGGEDVKKWRIEWRGYYILFPYKIVNNSWRRAFEVTDKAISRINDVLDFTKYIDNVEYEIMRENSFEEEKIKRMLTHRIALGLVRYPNVATYLVQYYQQLKRRVFEGKYIEQYNKMWYEYHRPRTPELIYKPKIVSPRLTKTARFALDTYGYLPRDSVVAIIPKRNSFDELKDALSKVLGRKAIEEEVLMYILAFLNSKFTEQLLSEKVSKKRGGYIIVNEELLKSICIPIPQEIHGNTIKKLLELVKNVINGRSSSNVEKEINDLVQTLWQNTRRDLPRESSSASSLLSFLAR
jgi:hypothetical protein